MPNYVMNGLFKSLPPNPKSTTGLTLFQKFIKRELDDLNIVYLDPCCTTEVQISAFYPQVAQSDIAAGTGGAIPVTNYLTTINTDAGGDAFTLANGVIIGQMKKILLVVDGGGNGVVTPATAFAGGAAATFNDAGDYLILQWNGTAWVVLENSGVSIA